MTKKFKVQHKIGDIVAEFPKATDIFMDYNIDFCCGGDRPLKTALKEKNLDQRTIITKLNKAYQKFKSKINQDIDWREEPITDLIDYIENTHHQFMREQLPMLNDYLNKILAAHYTNHGDLIGKIHKLFYQLKGEIEEHLIKEEKLLFPAIREYENNPSTEKLETALNIMEETEDEHDNAGDILKEIRALTNQYQLPDDACPTFRATYDELEEIEADLFEHIHLENNILFKRLKSELN